MRHGLTDTMNLELSDFYLFSERNKLYTIVLSGDLKSLRLNECIGEKNGVPLVQIVDFIGKRSRVVNLFFAILGLLFE